MIDSVSEGQDGEIALVIDKRDDGRDWPDEELSELDRWLDEYLVFGSTGKIVEALGSAAAERPILVPVGCYARPTGQLARLLEAKASAFAGRHVALGYLPSAGIERIPGAPIIGGSARP